MIIFCAGMSLVACNPFKETNPDNARFDTKKFSFKDYRNHGELVETLKKLIPPGTSKDIVDELLVDSAGAYAHDLSNNEEIKTAAGGGEFTNRQHLLFIKQRNREHRSAAKTMLYQSLTSDVSAGIWITVLYDQENEVNNIYFYTYPLF